MNGLGRSTAIGFALGLNALGIPVALLFGAINVVAGNWWLVAGYALLLAWCLYGLRYLPRRIRDLELDT